MSPTTRCIPSSHRIRVGLTTATLGLVAGCSVFDVIPRNHSESPPGSAPPDQSSPTAVATPKPLADTPLLRRLSLDLGLGMPRAGDLSLLGGDSDPNGIKSARLTQALLEGGDLPKAIAVELPRYWHLDYEQLPDLDAMVEAGDTGLAASLTAAARQAIINEPSALLRFLLEQRLPIGQLFASSYGISAASQLSLWNASDDGLVYPGESEHFTTYADGRPAAGLLVSPALAAAWSSRFDPEGRARAARLFAEVACLSFNGDQDTHKFTELATRELTADLAASAVSRSPCGGCHAQLEAAGSALATFATSDSLSQWLTYAPAKNASSGTYAGRSFTGLSAMAALLAEDPRTQSCLIERFVATKLQRPLLDSDAALVATATTAYYDSGLDLSAAAQTLVLSSAYRAAPLAANLKGDLLTTASGIRLLGRAHWQAIAERLLGDASGILLTGDLDPGQGEPAVGTPNLPTATYARATTNAARRIATAIVSAELADDRAANARRLLTLLPDGASPSAGDTVVAKQIKAMWATLTGVTLGDTDADFKVLFGLWQASAPISTADDVRRAWRTILVGALTHPGFFTY